MPEKNLTIYLHYPEGFTDNDLQMRHILVDTIQSRKIGYILNEGTGEGYTEVSLKLEDSQANILEITSILESLGLAAIAELAWEEEEEE